MAAIDPLLVLRAQVGDRDALEQLLRQLHAPLLRCIRVATHEPANAEDVLQDVLLQITRKLAWLRDASLVRPWAYRIALRRAIRGSTREPAIVALDAAGDPSATTPDPEQALLAASCESFDAMIAPLSPTVRIVLVLHYGEDLELDEVAAVLGIPPGTVRSRLAHGLAALRRRAADGQLP
jgi:RNA polymerase sigma factor (sigma-70 family)